MIALAIDFPGCVAGTCGPDVTRAVFSAVGDINRIDCGICTNPPILGLASEEILLGIEGGAVLRRQQ
ncbi:MAG TPA: hypothetical protein VF060_05260 [Trebonia sp.]